MVFRLGTSLQARFETSQSSLSVRGFNRPLRVNWNDLLCRTHEEMSYNSQTYRPTTTQANNINQQELISSEMLGNLNAYQNV